MGVFHSAGRVEDSDSLPDYAREGLRDVLDWFNDNLAKPRLDAPGWKSIFWFRDDARDMLAKIWDLVAILDMEGLKVDMLRTSRPGEIVYIDCYQVAAIPPKSRRR